MAGEILSRDIIHYIAFLGNIFLIVPLAGVPGINKNSELSFFKIWCNNNYKSRNAIALAA